MSNYKSRPFVFLSAPYSHRDPKVVALRIKNLCHIAAQIENRGVQHAISPLYNQLLLNNGVDLPASTAFWKSYSISLLLLCKELLVIRMPGWLESVGVNIEITTAEMNGIPIRYFDPKKLPFPKGL